MEGMMIGAIIGDIAGSSYEFHNKRDKNVELFPKGSKFTDDTVMTLAIFKALKESKSLKTKNVDLNEVYQNAVKFMRGYGRKYINCGFGGMFKKWVLSETPMPYGSFGNGSAMRVSAVPYFARNLEEVKKLSYAVTTPTHNSDEGILGAEAVAVAVFLAKTGKNKQEIKEYLQENYYNLDFDYEILKKENKFNATCQGSVPQALYCFLISDGFEDCLRITISIGGDTDTLCAISCAIAGEYYKVPNNLWKEATSFLDEDLYNDANDFLLRQNGFVDYRNRD